MFTLMKYEFKRTYKQFILYISITAAALITALLLKMFSVVYDVLSTINNSPTLLYLVGLNSPLNTFSYKNAIMVILILLIPFLYFFCLTKAASAFWHDYTYGNTLYFYSMPVSRIEYWLSKVLTHYVYILTYFAVTWGLSLVIALRDGTTKVKTTVTINSINRMFIAVFMTTLLFFSISVFLGSVLNKCYRKRIINLLYGLMVLLTVLPNMINGLLSFILGLISSTGSQLTVANPLTDIFLMIRRYIPLYYSNPWVTQHYGISKYILIIQVMISIILLGVSAIVYSRKNLVVD